ncbi:mycocerosic synthase [Mycobacterium tuberculosis]|nr:mycocerosic synthase [Mycobacterium tuberculosis]
MRTHVETETGIRLTPKVIATNNTARALAQYLADTLAEEQAAAPAGSSRSNSVVPQASW